MGIFSRFKDIVTSNINAMLDGVEDPEKMVRLMIQEMEDTLIEVKSSCAAVIADQKKIERQLAQAHDYAQEWDGKAKLAVEKNRDDLARAALAEKRRFVQRIEGLARELEHAKEHVTQFHSDIAELEAKLNDAREKQRSLIQRRNAAAVRYDAQTRIRQAETTDAFAKFEAYENNIERMEAETGLVNGLRPKDTLREAFSNLEHEDEIEMALAELKKTKAGKPE
jgi:phage shock protein A